MNEITVNISNEQQEQAATNAKISNALKYGRSLATVKNLPESPTREQVLAAVQLVFERTKGHHLTNDEVFALVPIDDLPHPRIHPYIGQWYRLGGTPEKLTDLFFEQHNKWLKSHRLNGNCGPIPKPKTTKPRLCPHCGKAIT